MVGRSAVRSPQSEETHWVFGRADRGRADHARCPDRSRAGPVYHPQPLLYTRPFVMAKRALITGITGQDGSYLAELLLAKGYEVHGIVRRASTTNYWRIEHLLERIQLHPADLLDQLSLIRVIDSVRPHEFYNLAAMSFVPSSWDQPMLTGEYNSQGVTRVLEAIRQVDRRSRSYQSSRCELF